MGADPVHSAPATSSRFRQVVWGYVSRSPLKSLWNLQGIPVRVIAQNTDYKGSIGSGKRIIRPLHELREIEKKRGLDLILA